MNAKEAKKLQERTLEKSLSPLFTKIKKTSKEGFDWLMTSRYLTDDQRSYLKNKGYRVDEEKEGETFISW